MQNAGSINIFSSAEHEVARELLVDLPPNEFRVLALRFWGLYSVSDISSDLNVSWEHAYELLSRALRNFKKRALIHPSFTRRKVRFQ